MMSLHYFGREQIKNNTLSIPQSLLDNGFSTRGSIFIGQEVSTDFVVISESSERIGCDLQSRSTAAVKDGIITDIDTELYFEETQNSTGLNFVSNAEMGRSQPTSYVLTDKQLRQLIPDPECWQSQVDVQRLRNNGFDKEGRRRQAVQSGSKLDLNNYNTSKKDNENPFRDQFTSLGGIIELSETIDSKIRPSIRASLRNLEEHGLAGDLYENVLQGQLNKIYDTGLDQYLQYISNDDSIVNLSSEVRADLIIDIKEDFSSLEFKTDEFSIIVKSPELLWDCHCKRPRGEFAEDQTTTNSEQISCPIHSSEHGDKLRTIFLEGSVLIKYDDIHVYWYNVPDFWPVSADSIHMYNNLKQFGVQSLPIKSVLDLGCGTGFLGIGMVCQNPEIRQLTMSDWLLTPLTFARLNWEMNYKEMIKHTSYNSRLGLGFDWIRQGRSVKDSFDVCISNPPYLPEVENFEEVSMQHAVGGTELLEKVIANGTDVANKVFVNFSDIALPEAETAANTAGVELRQIGDEHRVPFRVRSALQSKGYMAELESRKLEIECEGRYKYWHTVRTYEVVNE